MKKSQKSTIWKKTTKLKETDKRWKGGMREPYDGTALCIHPGGDHTSLHMLIKMHRTKYTHISACSVRSSHSVMLDSLRPQWTAVHQASLSFSNSGSLLKLMSIESVMPSNHLILCHPLLLWLSIFPSIKVFSNESTLRMRWPKYWSFSFSISPSNEYSGLTDWLSLQFKGLSRVFFNTTVQKHQFFGAQLSLQSNSIHKRLLEKP